MTLWAKVYRTHLILVQCCLANTHALRRFGNGFPRGHHLARTWTQNQLYGIVHMVDLDETSILAAWQAKPQAQNQTNTPRLAWVG